MPYGIEQVPCHEPTEDTLIHPPTIGDEQQEQHDQQRDDTKDRQHDTSSRVDWATVLVQLQVSIRASLPRDLTRCLPPGRIVFAAIPLLEALARITRVAANPTAPPVVGVLRMLRLHNSSR